MNTTSRILASLHSTRTHRSLVVAGVGMGLSAHAASEAGADIVIAYHSAPLRLRGLPSVAGILPVADANRDAQDLLPEVVRAAGNVPVGATVFAADPRITFDRHLELLSGLGATAVMNAPPATLLMPALADDLNGSGLGFERDLELTRAAARHDLLPVMYAFDAAQVAALIAAGASVIVLHLGITKPGDSSSHTAATLAEAVAVAEQHPDVVFLIHGGAIATPADVRREQQTHPRIDGFFGVSSIERLPIHRAVSDAVTSFAFTRDN
jgi:predicted TIM-barrel enzyme